VTRGREQVQVFTDDRKELFHALTRPDDPMSATELAESTKHKPTVRNRLTKYLTAAQQLAAIAARHHLTQLGIAKNGAADRGLDHDR